MHLVLLDCSTGLATGGVCNTPIPLRSAYRRTVPESNTWPAPTCRHHAGSSLRYIVACALLRIILTELDREISGWCVCADGLGMSPASNGNRTASGQNQPAEIAMFQISEVQEAPAFNGRLSILTLRVSGLLFCYADQWPSMLSDDAHFSPALDNQTLVLRRCDADKLAAVRYDVRQIVPAAHVRPPRTVGVGER